MSAGRTAHLRMLSLAAHVARTRSSPHRPYIIKPQVSPSLSTFSHFDNVGSCGTLLHRSTAGAQAWGPAPQGSRWIPRGPLT